MSNRKKVLVCGYYGNHNLGDEALISGMIQLLKSQSKNLDISVMSSDPEHTKKIHSVKGVFHNRPFRRRAGYILDTSKRKYFILGGGDLIRDSADSMVCQSWLKHLSRAIYLRRKTLVLGVSVGDIWRDETKKLIPEVLNQVDLIAVRDNNSRLKLEKLGVKKKINIINDLALFALPEAKEFTLAASKRLKIGISTRSLRGRGDKSGLTKSHDFQINLARIADFLVEEYNAELHFIPFHTYEKDYCRDGDDYINILETLKYSRFSEKMIVHRYIDSLNDLHQIILSLDLMIGVRLHSLILALGLGVPIIGAEYDSKIKDFTEEVGQQYFSIPTEKFTVEEVSQRVKTILSNQSEVQNKIVEGIKKYRQKSAPFLTSLSSFLE